MDRNLQHHGDLLSTLRFIAAESKKTADCNENFVNSHEQQLNASSEALSATVSSLERRLESLSVEMAGKFKLVESLNKQLSQMDPLEPSEESSESQQQTEFVDEQNVPANNKECSLDSSCEIVTTATSSPSESQQQTEFVDERNVPAGNEESSRDSTIETVIPTASSPPPRESHTVELPEPEQCLLFGQQRDERFVDIGMHTIEVARNGDIRELVFRRGPKEIKYTLMEGDTVAAADNDPVICFFSLDSQKERYMARFEQKEKVDQYLAFFDEFVPKDSQ